MPPHETPYIAPSGNIHDLMPLHHTLHVTPCGNMHDLTTRQETLSVEPIEPVWTGSRYREGIPPPPTSRAPGSIDYTSWRSSPSFGEGIPPPTEVVFYRGVIHTTTKAAAVKEPGPSPLLPNSCAAIGSWRSLTHHTVQTREKTGIAVSSSWVCWPASSLHMRNRWTPRRRCLASFD
jgi:hypothetical protein